MKSLFIAVSFAIGALFFTSCGEEPNNPEPEKPAATQADFSALKHLVLTAKPAEAVTISALKTANPSVGDSVTIQGRIGGAGSPFVSNHAAFMLADDTAMDACDSEPDDHCPKPWDYCCVPKAKRSANIVTVQAVDKDKNVIGSDINGLDDIKAGSFVIVKATVADTSNNNLLLNIDGLFHDRERKAKKAAGDHGHDHDHDHGHDHQH